MNNQFLPYEPSFDLKELGFNEECLATYVKHEGKDFRFDIQEQSGLSWSSVTNSELIGKHCTAPLYQQVFKWFRDKKILGEVRPIDDWNMWGFSITMEDGMSPFFVAHSSIYTEYNTYEEAELECIKTMIKISKTD